MKSPRLTLLLWLFVCPALIAADCDPDFNEVVRYGVEEPTFSAAAADFDGDGRPDIASMGIAARIVSLLLNRSDGFVHGATVTLPAQAAVLRGPFDLDRNGFDDLIAVGPAAIMSLISNGDATFRVVSTPVGGGVALTTVVVIADMNGDGHSDVCAVAQRDTGSSVVRTLRMFRGDGKGAFAEGTSTALTARIFDIDAADMTGDGKPDLVLSDSRNGLLLEGNGDGTFKQERPLLTGQSGISRIELGDFDGDARPDIHINGPKLVLAAQPSSVLRLNLSSPGWIVDLDGDGRLDIFTPYEIALGKGDGTFTSRPTRSAGGGLASPVFADFDGDGAIDVTGGTGWSEIAINYARSGLRFGGSQTVLTDTPFIHPLTGDLNGDGRDDVVAITGRVIRAYLAGSDGMLAYGGFVDTNASAGALADFNADGKLDLYLDSSGIVFGKGDGTFSAPGSNTGGSANHVVAADMNNDGKTDIVVTYGGDTTGTVYTYLNDGSGQLSQGSYTPLPIAAYGAVAADFNRDGTNDLIVATEKYSDTGELYLLDGRSPQSPVRIARGTGSSVAAADMDGDGLTDLVALTSPVDELLIFGGNGNGTFRAPRRINVSDGSEDGAVTVADITGDGRADVVVTVKDWRMAILFAQQADGSFIEATHIPRNYWWGAWPGDFNGDGRIDLVFDSSPSTGFTAVLNGCAPGSAPVVSLISSGNTLTATLDPAVAGTVIFYEYDNVIERVIGSASITAGRATLTHTLPAGTHEIYAVYLGEGRYTRSRSMLIEFVVAEAGPRRRSVRH
jgi:hypothetical protein